MILVNSFILGGVICAVFQLLLMFTKFGVPKLMGFGFVLGAVFTAAGIMPKLIEFGGGGILVMIVGAGEIVYNVGFFAASGMAPVAMGILTVFLSVVGLVLLFGTIAALVCLNKNPPPEK